VAWKDTYAELGAEIQAAKTAAINAFMAAPAEAAIGAAPAVPPILSRQQRAAIGIPLSSADVAKCMTVVWRAISQATLKHIGPVSTDGSILIGQQADGDGVLQLNLRTAIGAGLQLSDEDPLPDGVADPGVGLKASRDNHVHPLISDLRSYLFTAQVLNPLDRGQVACVFHGFEACGGEHTLFSGWTEVQPGLMVRDLEGPVTSAVLDGVDPDAFNTSGVSSMLGLVVMATGSDLIEANLPLQGPYIWEDVGGHYENYGTPSQVYVNTHATLRRHPDYNTGADFVENMVFQAQTGNVYGGRYIKLETAQPITLGTTELEFTVSDTPPTAPTSELLTASQITDASGNTVEAAVTIVDTDGYQTLVTTELTGGANFYTRTGIPGAAVIEAGNFLGQVKAKISDATTGITTLRFSLYKYIDPTVTLLFQYDTSAVVTLDYALKEVSQAIAEQDIAGARLILNIGAATTSTTPVTVTAIVNDPGHTCRISLPLEFVVGGNEDHRALTNRDADDQHPYNALEPVGLARVPFVGAALAAADSGGANGKLALGASNRYLVDPDGLDLTQIQTPTVAAGTTIEVMVMFTAPCLLVPNVTPDTGYTKLHLAQDASVTGLNLANPYSSMKFIYVAALSAFVRIQEAEL
jgi:hypothetical protein